MDLDQVALAPSKSGNWGPYGLHRHISRIFPMSSVHNIHWLEAMVQVATLQYRHRLAFAFVPDSGSRKVVVVVSELL